MWLTNNEMAYSTKWHMYLLNHEYVKNALGLDFVVKLGSNTKAIDKMYQISRTVYNYIYKHTHYKKQLEYWLAMDETLRDTIQRVLEEQARYEYDVDAEYFSKQLGVNVVNGIQIGLDKFRGQVRISPDAEDILRGNKLLYTGQYSGVFTEHDYTTDGY